ncbi:hypothetical protein [Xylanibacter caecicola]|uniref:hypothetical protein n=1 Tax=Xylanibacter caecicola TaxID=2736294 RepID=UPI00258CF678|nr:hypothetical protein [Xylanibacter caecicola]
MKVTSERLTISMFNQMLTYSRCNGSGPGGNPDDDDPGIVPDEPETNYALNDVSDYEFTFYKLGKFDTELYFTSNYSINADYSECSWSIPVSATYEKMSGNAAVINYRYKDKAYGNGGSTQFSLIFTSETEGKVLYEGGLSDVFVCKKKEKDVYASAPYNVEGMVCREG